MLILVKKKEKPCPFSVFKEVCDDRDYSPLLPSFQANNGTKPSGLIILLFSFIKNALSLSAETWDDETSQELFNNKYVIDRNAEYGVYDEQNSIVFGTYPDNNVIVVTSIWFIRSSKQIVEFDILFNQYHPWGDANPKPNVINPNVMDLQNIATHEFGHGVGMNDIYSTSFDYVTMYGYSTEGDTEKRDLAKPDINGLQKMYGQ